MLLEFLQEWFIFSYFSDVRILKDGSSKGRNSKGNLIFVNLILLPTCIQPISEVIQSITVYHNSLHKITVQKEK